MTGWRRALDLRPHPANAEIYGDSADAALVESVRARGVLTPILVTADGRILSGHRRWRAAQLAGQVEVPVSVFGSDDELDMVEALIESNRQREKTPEQRLREGTRLLDVERERAERRRLATLRQNTVVETLPPRDIDAGKARDVAARKVGLSGRTLEKGAELVAVLDAAAADGRAEDAQHIRGVLNKRGVHPAYSAARSAGLIVAPPSQEPSPQPPLPQELPARVLIGDATALPLAADSVDLLVTSPPYGLEFAYRGAPPDDPAAWSAFMRDWLGDALRVTKPGGRLALNVPLDTTRGGNRPTYGQAVAAALSAGWSYRWTVVWADGHLQKSVARGSVDSPAAPHVIAPVEMVAVFSKGAWKRMSDEPSDLTHDEWLSWTNGLWAFPGEHNGWEGHPAPFPAELPRRLIRLLSWPGDVVLDPFCGSGTAVLVAWQLRRDAIGVDISPQYVESTRRRLAAAGPR